MAAATPYSLALLAEYTNTLDALPIELSRSFADLRELDAVMSAGMTSIAQKINKLTEMIENGLGSKQERLWLLTDIAEEAARLKAGGEDKIRVAAQAADHLKSNGTHLRNIAEHIPEFDASILIRNTTYPHVAAKSFMPATIFESGRRRRGAYGSLLAVSEPSPIKRKRNVRDDDPDVRSPRKEKVTDGRSRNTARAKQRAASPTESLLSVTSHKPQQNARDTGRASSSRTANGNSSNARKARNNNNRAASPDHYATYDPSRRDGFNVPPSSNHPSLPLPYHTNGHPPYDVQLANQLNGAEWNPPRQLEGPGVPPVRTPAAFDRLTPPIMGTDGAATEGGDAEGDGDDRTYCYCDRASYGEMIACDDGTCEREWFHLPCIGLEVPPDGTWFCDTCKAKRSAKRSGRGGKRKAGGNRSGRAG